MLDREERVRRRAYDIWEREGRPEGCEERHWGQALAEVVVEDMAAGRSTADALDLERAVDPAARPAETRGQAPGAAGAGAGGRPADVEPGGGGER
jgi:hypothetical protein